MKRLVAAVVIAGLAGWVLGRMFAPSAAITVTRLSPDETLRALVVEIHPGTNGDRVIEVRLESLVDGSSRVLFRSPGIGGPPGTEQLIWSADGHFLLLTGRHFFVKANLFLEGGDQAYLLVEASTGKTWLNTAERSDHPPLTQEQLKSILFTEPLIWRESH
jgi:hypothetical protein